MANVNLPTQIIEICFGLRLDTQYTVLIPSVNYSDGIRLHSLGFQLCSESLDLQTALPRINKH